jgi:hypothetical protein
MWYALGIVLGFASGVVLTAALAGIVVGPLLEAVSGFARGIGRR